MRDLTLILRGTYLSSFSLKGEKMKEFSYFKYTHSREYFHMISGA